MRKARLILIGLLQSIGVLAYSALVAGVIWTFNEAIPKGPDFLGTILMLILLVFSAAITGAMVFGYLVYLAFHKKIKEALIVFGSTLVFSLVIMGIITAVLFAQS